MNEILLESELRHWQIRGGCEQKCLDRGELQTAVTRWTINSEGPSHKGASMSGGLWRKNVENWINNSEGKLGTVLLEPPGGSGLHFEGGAYSGPLMRFGRGQGLVNQLVHFW